MSKITVATAFLMLLFTYFDVIQFSLTSILVVLFLWYVLAVILVGVASILAIVEVVADFAKGLLFKK